MIFFVADCHGDFEFAVNAVVEAASVYSWTTKNRR